MPNTLIHLAAQGAASASVFRIGSAPRRWAWDWPLIFLAAVLPDLPWILQRGLRVMLLRLGVASTPDGDPVFYDLRLLAGIQGSLLFCLLLAAACASPTRRPMRCFAILSFGSLLHLLLDATQIKWANGVMLFAPFDWRLTRFDWFWPEHPATAWLSMVGLVASLALVRRCAVPTEPLLLRPSTHRRRWVGSALGLALYLLLPLSLQDSLEASGAYSVQALREPRIGGRVELGNAWVFAGDRQGNPGLFVRTMSERQVALDAATGPLLTPGRWSIRGRWVATDRGLALQAVEAHRHRRKVRESFSLVGLLLVAWLWLRCGKRLV